MFPQIPSSPETIIAAHVAEDFGVKTVYLEWCEELSGGEIHSEKLDYRDDPSVSLCETTFDQDDLLRSKRLAKSIGLTYAALDFIDNYFLEINSMPMFVAFDQISMGKIAKAIRFTLNSSALNYV